MIETAQKQFPKQNPKMPTIPLIRLKVEYNGFSTVNPSRFGQRYVGRVANPNDILLFYKKRTTSSTACKSIFEKKKTFWM